jgi:hypothetical protein
MMAAIIPKIMYFRRYPDLKGYIHAGYHFKYNRQETVIHENHVDFLIRDRDIKDLFEKAKKTPNKWIEWPLYVPEELEK